jgi:peptidoglycan/LPS O-acetylase OafA/YrhL
MQRSQIPALTGLRLVAAMCVVLAHTVPAILRFDEPRPAIIVFFIQLSADGMTLFFVLSGFVIFYNYSESVRSGAGIWNFFIARFARLYPLYAAVVAFDLLTKYGYYQFHPATAEALPFYATLTQSWIYLPIDGRSMTYMLGHSQMAWSVSTEWFFYMIFPFAALAIAWLASTRSRILACVALVIVAFVLLVPLLEYIPEIERIGVARFGAIAGRHQDSIVHWLFYMSPYSRVLEFLLGCLTASVYVRLGAIPSPMEKRLGGWLTAAALLAVAVSHAAIWHYWSLQPLHMNFGSAPGMALLIFCCARYGSPFARLMSARLIVLGGEISYSLYLLQQPVIHAFSHEVDVIHMETPRALLSSLLVLMVTLAAIIGLALVSWALIEVPARRALRRLLSVDTTSRAFPLQAENADRRRVDSIAARDSGAAPQQNSRSGFGL